jgi:hypothetical protein
VALRLPFAAGNFVYIAAADLVPQITSPVACVSTSERKLALRDKLEQSLAFGLGLATLWVSACSPERVVRPPYVACGDHTRVAVLSRTSRSTPSAERAPRLRLSRRGRHRYALNQRVSRSVSKRRFFSALRVEGSRICTEGSGSV